MVNNLTIENATRNSEQGADVAKEQKTLLTENSAAEREKALNALSDSFKEKEEEAAKNAEAEMLAEMKKRLISLKTEYPPEECLLKINDIEFLSKGDLVAIKARQKQGKTTALGCMVAATLKLSWGKLSSTKDGCKTIIFDTEQKVQDTLLLYKRILQQAEKDEEKYAENEHTNLQIYNLRTIDTEDMLKGITAVVKAEKPDLVIIDGIVDLIYDFNNIDESKNLIKALISLASESNICLICVLHENKSLQDRNMRGHLGTMLAQKAGLVLECNKDESKGVFTVKTTDSRHVPVPSWSFMYNKDGNVIDAEAIREKSFIANQKLKQQMRDEAKANSLRQKEDWFKHLLREAGGKMPRIDLRNKYMSERHVKVSATNDAIKKLVDDGKLIEEGGYIALPPHPELTKQAL